MDPRPETLALESVRVPALDEILGKKFPVLSDGFVYVVDYMGSDESIVQAARVSFGKGTQKVHEDRGLIRFLARHRHTTPTEMCEIKLHVRVPMDCWRQWIRHRTASTNEYSTRYSEAIDSMDKTPLDKWRSQAQGNRQGSGEFLGPTAGVSLSEAEAELHERARWTYERRLAAGVAREQARKDLPLSTYTEAYWKIDLHNLFHFLSLRMDPHAQKEIRDYANIIGNEIVKRWVPVAWEAFEDYRLGAMSLTRLEIQIICKLAAGNTHGAMIDAKAFGWLEAKMKGDGYKRNRERDECAAKVRSLSMTPPWEEGWPK